MPAFWKVCRTFCELLKRSSTPYNFWESCMKDFPKATSSWTCWRAWYHLARIEFQARMHVYSVYKMALSRVSTTKWSPHALNHKPRRSCSMILHVVSSLIEGSLRHAPLAPSASRSTSSPSVSQRTELHALTMVVTGIELNRITRFQAEFWAKILWNNLKHAFIVQPPLSQPLVQPGV